MWRYDDDASRLGSDSDMDRRAYQCSANYGAGLEGLNPVESVLEWTQGPARVQRRRCRSEGLERSPYDNAREPRSADGTRELRSSDVNRDRTGSVRQQPSKSHYTINRGSRKQFRHECMLPAENGDYIMSSEKYIYQTGRSKLFRTSPMRPLLVTTLSNTKVEDSRLPKVEELLEKVDHDMLDDAVKKPLKSILNNSMLMSPNPPKTQLPGILKKPKNKMYQDSKDILTGHRRQRTASESDYYCNYQIGSQLIDNRLTCQSANTKRAKDNSGTGYSYGTAIASLPNRNKSPIQRDYNKARCACKDNVLIGDDTMHLLRTTAINSVCETTVDLLPRQDTPTTASSAISPALPVSSVTAVSPKKVKCIKKRGKAKVKVSKMKSTSKIDCNEVDEAEDAHSRSPSPDPWQMEMDLIIPVAAALSNDLKKKEIEPAPKPVPKLTNGAAVILPKKLPSKDDVEALHRLQQQRQNSLQIRRLLSKVSMFSDKLNSNKEFLTALHTTHPFQAVPIRKDSPLCIPESVTSCLRPSLFPRVPPYLKFAGHDESSPLKMPAPIQKHLKWKLTTITPIVVQKTLTNSGFRLVKSECDTAECPQEETVEWIGIWGKHMKSLLFRAIKDGQKMNHFPGTFQIGRKDRLWRNLQKLSGKYGEDEFGIMPKTYVLPHDMKLLKHDWQKHAANNEKWIIKPPASARGTGIKVVSRWTQIPKKRPVVVQRYVAKPYLINGNKFDMRLYVLVTSVHPLRVYLYKDGLARFASVKYNDELGSLNDRYMHLTNYSINRLSKNYTPNEDFASCEGHKWTLQTLFQYLRSEKCVDTDTLWDSMKDLVVKTLIAGEASISSLTKANITSRYNCYELFGIDVLLDENLKPWLLEVNISPSLHSASPLDRHVKGPLVSTVLNIAQFQVPIKTNLEMLSKDKPHKLAGLPYDSRLYTVYLSKEERDKHIIYTNMEERDMYLRDILSTLTPDDVRHLLQAEDELTQAGDMERVFPDAATHKYLGFLAGPRYYNRLFDAWETRYGRSRDSGIELLRNLCDIGYHLEVPPVPLKNDIDAPSPPVSAPLSAQSLASCEDPSEVDPGRTPAKA